MLPGVKEAFERQIDLLDLKLAPEGPLQYRGQEGIQLAGGIRLVYHETKSSPGNTLASSYPRLRSAHPPSLTPIYLITDTVFVFVNVACYYSHIFLPAPVK